MILGAYNLACLLSLSGFVAAIAAIVLSSTGEIELALVCPAYPSLPQRGQAPRKPGGYPSTC